jgi:hypothetical protein
MYCRFTVISLLLLTTISSSNGGIDFTPAIEEYSSQGFVYRRVTLKEERGPIKFVLPQGWLVRGASGRLQLNPANGGFAEATITASPLTGPAQFNEATMEALKQQALRTAPSASNSVQLIRCEPNPVPMAPYTSVGFVTSYTALGRTFEKSMIFVQADDTQLVFSLTAPKEEFDGLYQLFRTSISSWQWRQPKTSGPMTASK